jgi:P-type Cu+ transporter
LFYYFLTFVGSILQTGTLTEGKPVVTAVASHSYSESEILRLAASVEKTASHPIAKAVINKAESLQLEIYSTRGQLTEPGSGCLAEVDGSIVAVGSLDWVLGRFQTKVPDYQLASLETSLGFGFLPGMEFCSNYSKSVVYVGREREGIIGAIAISDVLRLDAKSTVSRYMFHILLSHTLFSFCKS